MRGNITRRGKHSWRIKFDVGYDAATGKRRYHIETARGTKAVAQALLAKRLTECGDGELVKPAVVTLRDYAAHWLANIAPAVAAPKTRERYGEHLKNHIGPKLGAIQLQKLDGSTLDAFYQHLRSKGRIDDKGGLAPATVAHIHKLLTQILKSAVKAKKLRRSPMDDVQTKPKATQDEVRALDESELAKLLAHLKGSEFYVPALVAASTGLRRGELLGLRWADVDFDKTTLRVAQVVEFVGKSIAFKAPKTERSRRKIAIPASVAAELRVHRKDQWEHCLKIGVGRFDLVFPRWDGRVRNPDRFGNTFRRMATDAGVECTLHVLRHTFVTQLLRNGVPVHIVSAMAGHKSPTVTLTVYSHVLSGDQEDAASTMDKTLQRVLAYGTDSVPTSR